MKKFLLMIILTLVLAGCSNQPAADIPVSEKSSTEVGAANSSGTEESVSASSAESSKTEKSGNETAPTEGKNESAALQKSESNVSVQSAMPAENQPQKGYENADGQTESEPVKGIKRGQAAYCLTRGRRFRQEYIRFF